MFFKSQTRQHNSRQPQDTLRIQQALVWVMTMQGIPIAPWRVRRYPPNTHGHLKGTPKNDLSFLQGPGSEAPGLLGIKHRLLDQLSGGVPPGNKFLAS